MEILMPILLIVLGCALLTVTFIVYEPALTMQLSVYSSK